MAVGPHHFTLVTYNSLHADFASLILSVCRILSNSPNEQNNLKICKEYCTQLRISDSSDQSLLNAEEITKINKCHDIKQLFVIITVHVSWDEHSILTQIVNLCNSVEGQQEIEKFDKKVALFGGVEMISNNMTSKQVLSEEFAKVCVIINKPYKHVTIEEYSKVTAYIFANLDTKVSVCTCMYMCMYVCMYVCR